MEYWVTRLREQVAQIINGDYPAGSLAFTRAPAGMADLSSDLDRLAQLVAEREEARKALAREMHHRVKNNLQIITSLLNMQANRVENPAAREALGQTRARIGALALIHRILYDQGDDGSRATIDVAQLISELCALFRVWNKDRHEIMFSCHADPLAIPLDHAMPLALFAVEAVTNAYAYAFPEGRSGSLLLKFSVGAVGDVALSITDDGCGFDSTAHELPLGRQLMQGFARQLGGSFAILSKMGSGTEVRLDYRPPLDPAHCRTAPEGCAPPGKTVIAA